MDKIEKRPLGVIEALSGGFELVIRHPWILLVPVALDLFLWLGPQMRAPAVVFQQLIALVNAVALQGTPPDATQNLDTLRTTLQEASEWFNVFSFLAVFAIGMPSIAGLNMPRVDLWGWSATFSIGDGTALLGVIALFGFAGLFVSSVYLEGVARLISHDSKTPRAFAPGVLKAYANTLAFILLALLGGMVIMVPFGVGAVLISLVSQGLGSFLLIAGFLILLWAALYLTFALPAIFVSRAGVMQAIVNSIAVFRYNFWSAMSLIFLVYLLQMGFEVIWQALSSNPWGVLVDVVANAFLGTGLVAAAMLFYYDRFTWLMEVRERIRRQQRPVIKG